MREMDDLKPHVGNSTPLTPLAFLERSATVYGDCPSVVYNGVTYTWSETNARCLRLASALSSILFIVPGDVVSVLAPNTPAMYEMQFAVPMSGAVLNNLNFRLDARTLSVLLRHSGSKLIFADHEYLDLVRQAIAIMESHGNPAPLLVPILEPGESGVPGQVTYEGLVGTGDPNFKWVRPSSDWTPMVLNYTSGTTSAPKGVVHCHRGLFLITIDSLLVWSVPSQPVYLWTLPIFHANGWSFPWGIAAVGGVNVCLRKFDASVVYAAIRRHNITHMCGAPVVLNMLANNAPSPTSTSSVLPNPVHILTSGAPPPTTVLFHTEALGFSVTHGYGLTEAAGIIVSCAWKRGWNKFPASDRARLKARQGVRTLGMDEIDVVDKKTGRSVERDGATLGEVVLRGACIMLGYLKNPEATREAIRDGWFYTGDVGVMHNDGYLEIKDRSKDVIISGGENVSSVEVESVLYTHPAVNEAAVVARPDDFWGESPCAVLSVKGEVTEKEMVAYCRERLPHYMAPKTVVFKKELPRTSTGKINKFKLRETAKALGTVVASAGGTLPSRM